MAQSKSAKKLMNMIYGLGGAVVIVGALFKIQHLSIGPLTGGLMLTIGLLVEAGIFVYSAFEPLDEELDWAKVYPELAGGEATESSSIDSDGMLSQKLDNLLQEANIDSELMASLGNSIKDFSGAAQGLSSVSETISSSNKYNEQMSLAASQMESLNGLYQVQMESVSKQAELNNSVVENTERLKEQMESLASNLSSLNGVYGGMLSAMTKN